MLTAKACKLGLLFLGGRPSEGDDPAEVDFAT